MIGLPKISITKIQGVDWNEVSENEINISHLILSKNKSKIDLITSSHFSDFDSFVNEVKQDAPLALNISGKGVLAKIIPGEHDVSDRTLQTILPHASLVDFYIQISKIKNHSLVCIARKDKVDAIVAQFAQDNYRIIKLHFGPIGLSSLDVIFDNESISGSTHSINYEPIASIEKNGGSRSVYNFGKERVNSDSIFALGCALDVLISNVDLQVLNPSVLADSYEEEKHRKLFRTIGVGSLAFIFIALVINLFIFQNLNKEVSVLQGKTNANQVFLVQMDSLQNELEVKEQLAVSTGIKKQSRHSFYADKIGKSIPKEITLKVLSFDANDKKVKGNKPIVFNKDEVRIIGNTNNASVLNDWINSLEELEFTQFVGLNNYLGEGRKKGDFDIKIQIK